MGKSSREVPSRLAEKLFNIRLHLGLSQNEMLARLGLQNKLIRSDISKYERGVREPTLITLWKYAQSINVVVDVLIDDQTDLFKPVKPAKRPE